jgi:predicted DCC family thiol-disulfide oxidoreductase YuxK
MGSHGWTGGQYSLFRVLCGAYLLVHFTMLLPWGTELFSDRGVLPAGSSPLLWLFPNVLAVSDTPQAVRALLSIATVASLFFIVGRFDRVAALVIWYALACLFGRNPLTGNPSLPMVGWMLLAHACLPRAPFGSLAAWGRVDPRGGWRFTPGIFVATWIVMGCAYTYSGWTKLVSPSWVDGTAMARLLENPLARPGWIRDLALAAPPFLTKLATWSVLGLELTFGPLALVPRARPWIWLAMTLVHAGLVLVVDFADLSVGMLLFHLFAFAPAWIRGTAPGTTDLVFFDGSCGLCHRGVRFFLAEDLKGSAFQFAPLGGERFAASITGREALPDSLAVRTAAGETLVRSTAVIHLMKRLGGLWRVLATLARAVPRVVRDLGYDAVAKVRYRLFGRRSEACPLLPPDLRSRFVE